MLSLPGIQTTPRTANGVKGLIQKGKLVNDKVSYPWPTESLFTVFVKNNPIYRVWLISKKR